MDEEFESLLDEVRKQYMILRKKERKDDEVLNSGGATGDIQLQVDSAV